MIKDWVISKGKKAKSGPVHTRDITVEDLWECFFPKPGDEFGYLGYAYYYVDSKGKPKNESEELVRQFFVEVEKVAKPKLCPRFYLRLLHLFGNDKSVVRMRSLKLSNKFYKLTKGIRISDMKWKWETFRIYGSFTKELHDLAEETCKKIEDLHK